MAKVKFQSQIVELRGTLNNLVFKRSSQGEILVTKRPDMTRVKWSKAQKAHRQRFKLAVAYARAALAEPKARAGYERRAKKQGKRAWGLAVSDYLQGKDLLAKNKS